MYMSAKFNLYNFVDRSVTVLIIDRLFTLLNIISITWRLYIFSFFFSDLIKEVIDQQSTMYDNVQIVANYFKYEQVGCK